MVTTYNEDHLCLLMFKNQRDKHVIYEHVVDNIKFVYQDPSRQLRSKEIISDIKNKTRVTIIYKKQS